jgi:hypothetical protein
MPLDFYRNLEVAIVNSTPWRAPATLPLMHTAQNMLTRSDIDRLKSHQIVAAVA